MRWEPKRLLEPRKPIKRTPLRRSQKPIKRTPVKRKTQTNGKLVKSRKEVSARSGGQCEARLPICTGTAEAVHHVLRRSQGGGHEPENLLHLCNSCHQWVHANPAKAVEKGLLRRSYD
jgi:5-methylcytosine-specific restriction endonuclease McrA